ncbi:hypothetical protein E6P78_31605 [Streptomyces sp. A0958]|uniref:hypothetical protein n=1 Tax=Streptomyces sp. A0958 TaxID=2563101 RepID=UPI00109EC1A6|nr:hypothetical protein [Streptomyces sp. A0958]THA57041.1 hypothetical protein E6P78_31605 [Streptomyces sp. A0958]
MDALVGSGGGLLLYDQGLAGREALVAAGAQLAVASGRPLTVVDAASLRNDTAAFLDRLGMPHHIFLSPAQAASWPTGFTPDSELVIHADVLLHPAVEEPLLAAAREASSQGKLLVARRPDGAPVLDALTAQTHQLVTGPVTTAQAQADAGTLARYEPGPLTASHVQDDSSDAEPTRPRLPSHRPGPAPVGVARRSALLEPEAAWINVDTTMGTGTAAEGAQTTGIERDPLTEEISRALYPQVRMIRPNPYPEQAANMAAWAQSFTAAASTPNRTSEETRQRFRRFVSEESRQGLQRLFGTLRAPGTAEGTPSRSDSPDATGTPHEPCANTSWPPAHSPDSGQDGALSIEELNAALEDPDLLRRVQQQAESLQARVLARMEQAAAAAGERRQADADRATAQGHAPGSSGGRHDTAQQQAYGQDQNAARRPGH